MGFAVWLEPDAAWAEGTYEYRAMGAAVISNTDLFRPGDFDRERKAPPVSSPFYVGHFASIGHVNGFLLNQRRVRAQHTLTHLQSPQDIE